MTASRHHPFRSKLDIKTAEEIRARHRTGEAPRALAREYGVAPSSLYEVLRGRSHRPAVVVRLRPLELERLEKLAERSDQPREEVARKLISRGLEPAE
jgi:hypothetical protein